jgi:DNA-binding IclR family transcriptional regulator
VRLSRPTLQKIGAETGETVNLSVTRGDRVVQVAQVDSTYLLGTRDWTTVDVPPHASALGKVMLAHGVVGLPEGDLEQLTTETVTDRARLRRELEQVAHRGWASTADELEIGLSGIAAPVRGSGGDVVAALGISGPSTRLQDRRDEFGRRLNVRAEQLSGLLRRRTRKEGVA